MVFTHGNAAVDGANTRSWFVGDLRTWFRHAQAPNESHAFGLRDSAAVEMKWGVHRAGDTRPEWAACVDKYTMSLLVRGRFRLQFRSPGRGTVIDHLLQQEGDYVIWGVDLEHTWVVETDSVILTIRWNAAP